ncbi:MAG: hypothetical protein ACRDT0_19800 [Pseudonocardiaceae bacterium]
MSNEYTPLASPTAEERDAANALARLAARRAQPRGDLPALTADEQRQGLETALMMLGLWPSPPPVAQQCYWSCWPGDSTAGAA